MTGRLGGKAKRLRRRRRLERQFDRQLDRQLDRHGALLQPSWRTIYPRSFDEKPREDGLPGSVWEQRGLDAPSDVRLVIKAEANVLVESLLFEGEELLGGPVPVVLFGGAYPAPYFPTLAPRGLIRVTLDGPATSVGAVFEPVKHLWL